MASVNNMDIAGLIRRVRRFRFEINKAASANVTATSDADLTRATAYLDAITAFMDWTVSQPQLDLPESSPRVYELGEPEALTPPENEAFVDLQTMFDLMEIELANCQSARLGSGIISHDEQRFRAVVAKGEAFLTSYLSAVQPLDVPESTPGRANTGMGRSGV